MTPLLTILYVVPAIICLIFLAFGKKGQETKITFAIFLGSFLPGVNILIAVFYICSIIFEVLVAKAWGRLFK